MAEKFELELIVDSLSTKSEKWPIVAGFIENMEAQYN